MRRPILISTILFSTIVLSNCATTEGENDASTDDIVLMPSLSHHTNRGKVKGKQEESNDQPDVQALASDNPSPTPAQQEAALSSLAQVEQSNQSLSSQSPVAEPEYRQSSALQSTTILRPEADIDSPAPPLPNEVELQGLRSPKMPDQLPMKF